MTGSKPVALPLGDSSVDKVERFELSLSASKTDLAPSAPRKNQDPMAVLSDPLDQWGLPTHRHRLVAARVFNGKQAWDSTPITHLAGWLCPSF